MAVRRAGASPPWKCGSPTSPAKSRRAAPAAARPPPGWRDTEAKLREDQLRVWQQAKRERIEQEKALKAANPRFDPSPSKPKTSKAQIMKNYSFGAAGSLLRAARVLPTTPTSARTALPLEPRNLANSMTDADDVDRLDVASAECTGHTPSTDKQAHTIDNEFLEMCLGGPDALFEHEVGKQHENGKENATSASDNVVKFSLKSSPNKINEDDSDGESSTGTSACSVHSDEVDLEDMFAFEPETLADLVRKGTTMSQLTAHLQATYADALERRLAGRPPSTVRLDDHQSGASTPRPVLQAGHVSQHMTPEGVTPAGSPRQLSTKNEATDGHLSTFAQHALVEAVRLAQRRSRCSAALRHRPSALKRESAAVKAAELYGRRSLAHAKGISSQEVELLQGALESVVKTVSRRHRRSVNKAVEVLECVADAGDEPLEEWPDDKVDATVDLIQGAMDEAIKRHRRSIAEAVEQASASSATRTEDAIALASGSEYPNDAEDGSVEARIQRAVSVAYSHRSATSMEKPL